MPPNVPRAKGIHVVKGAETGTKFQAEFSPLGFQQISKKSKILPLLFLGSGERDGEALWCTLLTLETSSTEPVWFYGA